VKIANKNKKARILAESGPLERELMEGRLYVFHSRMRSAVEAIAPQLQTAGCKRASAHRGGMRKRNHDRVAGRAGCDGGPGNHDGFLWVGLVDLKLFAFCKAVDGL
jgi:hypothetical protein